MAKETIRCPNCGGTGKVQTGTKKDPRYKQTCALCHGNKTIVREKK